MLATLLAIIAISTRSSPDLHNKKYVFDIPAGNPRVTIISWMRAGDVFGVFDPEVFSDLTTHNVRGVFTACEALRLMIAGTPIIAVGENGSPACPEILTPIAPAPGKP